MGQSDPHLWRVPYKLRDPDGPESTMSYERDMNYESTILSDRDSSPESTMLLDRDSIAERSKLLDRDTPTECPIHRD